LKRFLCFPVVLIALLVTPSARSDEFDALAISETIVARHMPYGTILDPIFAPGEAGPDGEIVGYSRCGDSPIWTGHYLAAESFRYAVTRSPESLAAVRDALRGVRSLVDVTGTDLLARCLFPTDSPFAAGMLSEESPHGSYTSTLEGKPYFWVGNTSRDQYSGVFFGLAVAYDFVGETGVQDSVREIVTRLLNFLLRNNWFVVMPDGWVSTVFWGRPDQQLSLLGVGRQVNPERFESFYKAYRFSFAGSVAAPISWEVLDPHNSYYKFNLDTINLYNLIRLEGSSYYRWWYWKAYDILRRTTDDHGNAHFNVIDRALRGEPNADRDTETRLMLEAWLQRPRRDEWLDWRGTYTSCVQEDRACEPIPIEQRIRTDFLWQRSPFLLYGGGSGVIESAGIDYILPYWMGRFYGVL